MASPTIPAQRRRVAFRTLGCKLNQFDTERIREELEARGCRAVGWDGDPQICVINTCTVTGRSDQRSRQLVRQAVREAPGAVVVVTGCYAQRDAAALAGIPGVDLVLGHGDRTRLAELVPPEKLPRPEIHLSPLPDTFPPEEGVLTRFGGHARAFLKIQEGCDYACAYCAVTGARGRSRSLPMERLLLQVGRLVDEGYRELVLAGVELGHYGKDLRPRRTLAEAVEAILALGTGTRLRLSSLDPTEVAPELRGLLRREEDLARHLHLPLQSGDDAILRRMGRRYTAAGYRELVEELAGNIPGCAIGADVMVGFPGEDERAFTATEELIRSLPLAYLHVFPFSPRPGTRAAGMAGEPSPDEKKERSRRLRRLAREKTLVFRRAQRDSLLEVLIEGPVPAGEGVWGLSDNYVRVTLPEGSGTRGELVRVRVVKVTEESTWGCVVQEAARKGRGRHRE